MSREPQNPPYDKLRNIGQFKLLSDVKNHILISFEDAYLTLVFIDW